MISKVYTGIFIDPSASRMALRIMSMLMCDVPGTFPTIPCASFCHSFTFSGSVFGFSLNRAVGREVEWLVALTFFTVVHVVRGYGRRR